MIYFDNAATTLIKPPEVAEAVKYAINNLGNASRSFYPAAMEAGREIYKTRVAIAELVGLADPLQVAFTSSATESLNLVIGGLIKQEDSVITTTLDHNATLRPLHLTGCNLRVMDCDDDGRLLLDSFDELAHPDTKFLVMTHGSNVLGNVNDAKALRDKCRARGITMILDISQTFGSLPFDINLADIFCFTGHKGLYGPQGTGGIIVNGEFDFKIVKSGGAGVHSFAELQAKIMPDIFESGTLNSHSLYGLQKGVDFVARIGIENIQAHEMKLTQLFYEGLQDIPGITVYGDFSSPNRLPVVALNVEGMTSSTLSRLLWEEYGIATRSGSHCAPLLHRRFGTVDRGMTRFSFSYFNTEKEIEQGLRALRQIVNS